MDQDKTFLGTEPVGKLLLKLAVPTVIAQLVNMLYNIVDRIYIGHMPGDGSLALTGIGVCMPIILIVSAFASFSATGGAPRASIFMGRGACLSSIKSTPRRMTRRGVLLSRYKRAVDEDAEAALIDIRELIRWQRVRAESGFDRVAGAVKALDEPVLVPGKA